MRLAEIFTAAQVWGLVFVLFSFVPSLTASERIACKVTTRPEPSFVPPKPFPQELGSLGKFFVGSDKLWTFLSDDPWKGVPTSDGLRVKVPWFVEGLTSEEQSNPQISIFGRRLNDPEAHMKVEGPNAGYIGNYYFFPSALIFSTDGCWEVTAKRKDAELKLVVLVVR